MVEVNLSRAERRLSSTAQQAVSAGGRVLHLITLANFGSTGLARPWPWWPLSPAYARQVGRLYATLFVSGALYRSVKKNDELLKSTVSISNQDVPYALAHHYGYPKGTMRHPGLPARRVLPIDWTDEVLPDVKTRVVKEVASTFQRRLK